MRCAPKAASAKGHGLFRGNGEAIQPHADPPDRCFGGEKAAIRVCAAADDLADAGGVCPAPAGFDEVSHLRKSGFDEVSHLRNHAILVGVAESRPIAEIRAAKLVSDPST